MNKMTWLLLPALVLAGLGGGAAVAANRIVVAEEFTSVTWGYCPYAGTALGMMLDNFPDTFATVAIHSTYPTAWGNARRSFYGITGVPTVEFDGWLECRGAYTNVQQQYNWYYNTYLTAMNIPTDVVVELDVFKVATNRIKVKAQIGVEAGGVAKNMRVHVVQVLDRWPFGYTWTRDGVKQAEDKGVISLNAGQTMEITHEFTLDGDCMANPHNVKVVVFVQDPLTYKPAQIFNTGFKKGPFGFRKGDLNCDGEVNFADINPFVLALTNPAGYQATFPNCDIMNADINSDGVVDFRDINPFVLLLTAP